MRPKKTRTSKPSCFVDVRDVGGLGWCKYWKRPCCLILCCSWQRWNPLHTRQIFPRLPGAMFYQCSSNTKQLFIWTNDIAVPFKQKNIYYYYYYYYYYLRTCQLEQLCEKPTVEATRLEKSTYRGSNLAQHQENQGKYSFISHIFTGLTF